MTSDLAEPDWFPRWRMTVTYRTDTGPSEVDHLLCELDEARDLIERGPSWDAIDLIEIRLIPRSPALTVEQAEQI